MFRNVEYGELALVADPRQKKSAIINWLKELEPDDEKILIDLGHSTAVVLKVFLEVYKLKDLKT